MKNSFKKLLIVVIAFIGIATVIPKKAKAQVGISVSFQTFYDDLSPYGQWVEDPRYGNVWVPDVDAGFRPYYTNGYWAMTEYGNTWVSDYDWGWAPFHYGRWVYNSYYGWVWIPGSEWAPAWVSWRNGGGYYGWAPLSPGYSGYSSYNCPGDWWVFVGPEYLYRHDFYRGWRGERYNDDYIRRTTFYNNVYTNQYNHTRYNYGPRADEIQRVTHASVPVYRMGDMSRPGRPSVQSNRVNMYHPQLVTGRANDNRFAPKNVITAPRAVGSPQSTTQGRPQFKTDLQQHRITPQNTQPPVQQQRQQQQPVQQQRQQQQQQQVQQQRQQQQQQMQQQRQQQQQQQVQQQRQQQQQVQQQRQQQQQQQVQQQRQQQQQQMQQQRQQQQQQQVQQQRQQQQQQQVQQQRQQQQQQQVQQQRQQQQQQKVQQQRQQQQQQMQQQRQQPPVQQQRQQGPPPQQHAAPPSPPQENHGGEDHRR